MSKENKELLRYLIVGGLTTLVSLGIHALCRVVLGTSMNVATIVSWICAVSFAFVTNKYIVFQKNDNNAQGFLKEAGLFFGARVVSLGVEVVMMNLLVSLMGAPESFSKVFTQFFIVVINYVFSKKVIFK